MPVQPYQASSAYVYQELADVTTMETYQKGNFYAVVSECSPHRSITKTGDEMCTLKLVDLSTIVDPDPDVAHGLTFTCFAVHRALLPHLRKPGDIIRIHRAYVGNYGKPQLNGKLNPQKGGNCSVCLFDASPGPTPNEPYHCSSRNYHFDEREAEILAALRSFSQAGAWRRAVHPHIKVKDVRPATFYDVVAKVLAVHTPQGEPPVLFVWDSTDAPPFRLTDDTTTEAAAAQQPSNLHVQALPLAHMSAAALSSLPCVGTAFPVVVHAANVNLPQPGSWVKLRNIGARVVQGQLQGVYNHSSWSPWQEEGDLEENYRRRRAQASTGAVAEWAPANSAEWLASCAHADQPFTSLRQVLADLPAATPTLYRCLVRLLSYQPGGGMLRTMCVRAADCWAAARAEGYTDPSSWLFAGVVMVEDATGRLDADLFGRDAERFFADVAAPGDLRADARALGRLEGALEAALEVSGGSGPWLDVALASYFADPSRPWETARFRLRHCKLRLPPHLRPA